MLDVFIPAVDEPTKGISNGISLNLLISSVANSVERWAEEAAPLQAKRGRAAYLGPRSIGHVDPGAKSSAMWWKCLDQVTNS